MIAVLHDEAFSTTYHVSQSVSLFKKNKNAQKMQNWREDYPKNYSNVMTLMFGK